MFFCWLPLKLVMSMFLYYSMSVQACRLFVSSNF